MRLPNKTAFRQLALFWALPVIVACLSIGLQLLEIQTLLRYERIAVQQGQYWRFLTGNFVHLGWSHLGLNITGLAFIWLLLGDRIPILQWLVVFLGCSLLVGLGLYVYTPALVWYVGLSGVLHGLFVMGLLVDGTQTRLTKTLFLLVLSGKLLWEQISGALPGSEYLSGGAVVVDAHLYGAVGGVLMFMVLRISAWIIEPSDSYSK